jgi:RNA polymerase sigma factor (TIGR02999 family)
MDRVTSSESGDPPLANSDITRILNNTDFSDPGAQERLLELLYPELKRIAEARMRVERTDHTLQPTALVNEFYLNVARLQSLSWKNRAHFLAVASNAMRRVLIDHARARRALKRQGAGQVQLDDMEIGVTDGRFDAIAVNEVLDRLAQEEPRMARVVEMRYFGGLTNEEVAEVLKVDARTVKRDWQVARAWLRARLIRESPPS